MKQKIFLPLLCLLITNHLFAQLQSPEQFLGYKIGTHFTPHYKIVNYVRSIAQARPDMVKVEKYGETYEGRELLLTYIATAENLLKLDVIRLNNLSIAGVNKNTASVKNSPAIVWLSYNVHGNETSSSEAAMQTLFAFVDPANTKTKEWLKNTVIIMDPCLNPDGRDRYVNWFNAVSSKNTNADPQSREHVEPWPGGRTNHYNFDLNRDWAWQTQIETQQRMVKYNQWLPQVHVDFHEQSYNDPYYFAPAAEPFHEVITPWQREFQHIIGRNHAKYFDENGWLYFTKERFDLFYPSYGDTYPIYSGAIGMTFEQGGGPRGGLSVVTNSGDTLTLQDRVNHHYTTGLSTVEAASKNAGKLVTEYKKFFEDSRAGKGNDIKTYVVTSDNAVTIGNISNLLKANGIEYGSLGSNYNFRGLNYSNLKSEKGQLKKYNIAISTLQTRSVLAKVLLEPHSNLLDSNTYDITAWALPYAYNTNAYAVKEILPLQTYSPVVTKPASVSTYGYLIKYNSVNSVKVLAHLLKEGVKVRFSEKDLSYNGKLYPRGTLIVLQRGNPLGLTAMLNTLVVKNEVEIEKVSSGYMEKGPDFGSPDIKVMQSPKVALITGEQTSSLAFGEIWHFFEQQLDYPVTLINAGDLPRASLENFNVIIIPDGNYPILTERTLAVKLKEFVSSGGNLIAMKNAIQLLNEGDLGIKQKEEKEKDEEKGDYSDLRRYENRERDDLVNSIPGAVYKVQLDNSHPLAFGYPDNYYTLKQDANVYEFLKDGWNVGFIKKDNYLTGFAGSKVKKLLKDGLVFGVRNIGSGSVIFLADDPLFRQFWEGGKLLFCNAVFLVGQ